MKKLAFTTNEVSTTKKQVEIDLPFYAKDIQGNHFVKVVEEDKALQVFISIAQHDKIEFVPFYLSEAWAQWEQISEEEFLQAFNRAFTNLQNAI